MKNGMLFAVLAVDQPHRPLLAWLGLWRLGRFSGRPWSGLGRGVEKRTKQIIKTFVLYSGSKNVKNNMKNNQPKQSLKTEHFRQFVLTLVKRVRVGA